MWGRSSGKVWGRGSGSVEVAVGRCGGGQWKVTGDKELQAGGSDVGVDTGRGNESAVKVGVGRVTTA